MLLDALSKGSADSFALRHHGRNAMLPRLSGAGVLDALCAKGPGVRARARRQAGIDAPGARLMRERFARAIEAGDGDRYWPVIAEHVAREDGK